MAADGHAIHPCVQADTAQSRSSKFEVQEQIFENV